jgi:ATP-binding cassette subfamily C protein
MGLASGLLGMVTPIATGIIFDSVIPGAQRGQLFQLSMFLVISAISTALFTLTRSIALLRLEGKMDASIQAAVWDRLLALPVPFFREYSSGDLATRGMGINQIRQTLTGSTLSSILSGFFSIFSFALLFYYSWRLALLATGLIAVAFIVSTVCGYLQVSQQRTMSKIRGRISGMVLQFINGISKFRVAGTEGRAFAAWAREFTKQKDMSMKARGVTNGLTVFNAAFPVLSTAGIYYYTAYLMTQPSVTPLTTGDFLAFNSAFGQFLQAALQLSSSFVSVLGIVPLYERAQPIFHTLPEVDDAKGDPGVLRGNIEVNHLAFRYREDTPLVLRDLSLSIAAGEFVAFVGASGCGKSTLFRLLLGFEKPESGAIYYDGQDMAGLDIQAVRQQMGVVLQNGKLLSGDIFTNIVGSAPLTVEDAWEAARLSGLDQDISAMPMGMHTVVSEGGGGLSGGQRQRLMIARAIVGKPRILLFDEATSALDNQTQATVGRSLEALQATRIVIAHRLSTIINADRIFVLDKGVVVQSGSYQELIEQEGLFADLAKRQLT